MLNIAERLKEVKPGPGNIDQIPEDLWENIMKAIEEYGLLRPMEEAENSGPSLSREDALTYLEGLESREGIRIISLCKANTREREFYERQA